MTRRLLWALLAGSIAAGAALTLDLVRAENERARARANAEARVDEQAERLDLFVQRNRRRVARLLEITCHGADLEPDFLGFAMTTATALGLGDQRDAVLVRPSPSGPVLIDAHVCDPDGARVAVLERTTADFVADYDMMVPTRLATDEQHPAEARRSQTIGDETASITLVTWVAIDPVPNTPPLAWILASCIGLLVAAIAYAAGGRPPHDHAIEAAARRVGAGDLDVTLDGRNATASAFNRMTRELKDARTRLARAERIAAWRDIARRIAHEIKNPLTPIKVAMETLRKTHARKHPDFDEILDESTKTVLEETARLEKIVTEFSRFARMPRPNAESIDVLDIAEKVVAMHDAGPANATVPEVAAGARVELRVDRGKTLPSVRADREQLTQVLVNLVQNASDAAREKQGDHGGRVIVALTETEHGGVRIVVSDNGPGIPAESRDAVREPYYTTKSHGTGLGLAIVDRIVSDHGGVLSIEDDREVGGAAIVIVLRREGPSEEADASVGA